MNREYHRAQQPEEGGRKARWRFQYKRGRRLKGEKIQSRFGGTVAGRKKKKNFHSMETNEKKVPATSFQAK